MFMCSTLLKCGKASRGHRKVVMGIPWPVCIWGSDCTLVPLRGSLMDLRGQ